MNLKTQIVNEKNLKEMNKDPRSKIRPAAPGLHSTTLEPVVIGGVAFYLDHENQMVIPMDPTELPELEKLNQSPSKSSFSRHKSKLTSSAITPAISSIQNSPGLRKVSFHQLEH